MFGIRYVSVTDKPFWLTIDQHMSGGCLILDNTPSEQPQEMFMIETL